MKAHIHESSLVLTAESEPENKQIMDWLKRYEKRTRKASPLEVVLYREERQ